MSLQDKTIAVKEAILSLRNNYREVLEFEEVPHYRRKIEALIFKLDTFLKNEFEDIGGKELEYNAKLFDKKHNLV